jgi:hypothetical protein
MDIFHLQRSGLDQLQPLQTRMPVLLGPDAIAAASKDHRLQSSKLVDPVVTRHIALAMSRR